MYRLQWGHAFVSVETENMLGLQIMPDELQWGHAFVSVETAAPREFFARDRQLQWGHAFVSVETGGFCPSPGGRGLASMGPRFCKRGNKCMIRRLKKDVLLQWGHAFVSVETYEVF